ncbi:hypothetical protein D9M73_147230 [compost metagenome]
MLVQGLTLGIGFQQRLDLGHACLKCIQGCLDIFFLSVALPQGGGRQEAHLGPACIEQMDIGILNTLEHPHVLVVKVFGGRADAPHVKDSKRTDGRTNHGHN